MAEGKVVKQQKLGDIQLKSSPTMLISIGVSQKRHHFSDFSRLRTQTVSLVLDTAAQRGTCWLMYDPQPVIVCDSLDKN